jgi:hypothetical protein
MHLPNESSEYTDIRLVKKIHLLNEFSEYTDIRLVAFFHQMQALKQQHN